MTCVFAYAITTRTLSLWPLVLQFYFSIVVRMREVSKRRLVLYLHSKIYTIAYTRALLMRSKHTRNVLYMLYMNKNLSSCGRISNRTC
jgi:hypothetical protein